MVLNRLSEMIDHLESHGYRVMIYTNKNGFARFVKGRLEGYPLWICSLVDEPKGPDWQLGREHTTAGSTESTPRSTSTPSKARAPTGLCLPPDA